MGIIEYIKSKIKKTDKNNENINILNLFPTPPQYLDLIKWQYISKKNPKRVNTEMLFLFGINFDNRKVYFREYDSRYFSKTFDEVENMLKNDIVSVFRSGDERYRPPKLLKGWEYVSETERPDYNDYLVGEEFLISVTPNPDINYIIAKMSLIRQTINKRRAKQKTYYSLYIQRFGIVKYIETVEFFELFNSVVELMKEHLPIEIDEKSDLIFEKYTGRLIMSSETFDYAKKENVIDVMPNLAIIVKKITN